MFRSLLLIGGFLMGAQISVGLAQSQTENKAGAPRVSEGFRQEHVGIKKELAKVDKWAQDLSKKSASEQKQSMAKIVSFFAEHIKPHAKWEEEKLYPAVDKRASQGPHVFTETMRYEHRIVGRWIEDLAIESKKQNPNAQEFVRKTHRLLGLIEAHFELEEEVLLPILDRSMTPAQFQSEVMTGSDRH